MPSHKFQRFKRLLNASDYKEVFDHNRVKVANSYLLILAKPTKGAQSRLGLIIAKKNISTAVQRNRVKRVARETFRQKEFSVVMDIVLLARTGANRLSNEQLTQALNTAWSHLDARSQQQRVKHA